MWGKKEYLSGSWIRTWYFSRSLLVSPISTTTQHSHLYRDSRIRKWGLRIGLDEVYICDYGGLSPAAEEGFRSMCQATRSTRLIHEVPGFFTKCPGCSVVVKSPAGSKPFHLSLRIPAAGSSVYLIYRHWHRLYSISISNP